MALSRSVSLAHLFFSRCIRCVSHLVRINCISPLRTQWSHHSVCVVQWAGKIFRLVVVIVVILMCSINNQASNRIKRRWKKSEQNHTNAIGIYLRICVMHFLWVLFSCQFLLFFLDVRDDEYSSITAASQLFPFSLWCVYMFLFIFLIYFFSVIACRQMKYFIGLCTFMWIKQTEKTNDR